MNNDKNIRYIALNTLLKSVAVENAAVQRHRGTVLECLKDPDQTIRKRAMELTFALINHQNVTILAKELLTFLGSAETELKSTCASNLVAVADKYAPDRKWHLDTLFRVLEVAGNSVRDDVTSSVIYLVGESPDQHGYSIRRYKRRQFAIIIPNRN